MPFFFPASTTQISLYLDSDRQRLLHEQEDDFVSKKKTAILLRQALLYSGQMERALYEYELEEHIDDWYQGLLDDQNDFVFAVTENSGHVAMVLITPERTIYVNEEARDYLSNAWSKNYRPNI